jgi:hypothetical protein
MEFWGPKSGLSPEDEGSMSDNVAHVMTYGQAREGNVRGSSNVVGGSSHCYQALHKAGQETNLLRLRKRQFFYQTDPSMFVAPPKRTKTVF